MNLIRIDTSLYALVLSLLIACNNTASVDSKNSINTTKIVAVDTSLKWIDYRIGELPPVGYYDAIDSIMRKWGIRYERVEGGCEVIPGKKENYEMHNHKYFEVLVQKYGKDWRQKFDAEVAALDRILSVENSKIEDSINALPSVKCIDRGGDMEKGFTEECIYYKSTLNKAYTSYRLRNIKNDDGKYLEPIMPKGAHTADYEEYSLSIMYTYTKPDILDIEITFPGGVTYITFRQQANNVEVTTVNSPD